MFAAFARSGRRFSLAGTLMLGLIGGGCSPLRLFNAAMPKDAGSLRAISGVQFMDGQRGELDLYVPRSPPGTGAAPGAPVIVFFYGGSWNSGARQGYGFVGRALAARGFLVAIPDYRLVPQVRYPAFLEDNAAAIRWLRVHARAYGGDPDRLILAGHSAGAYNAAMLAMDPRWLGADRAAVKGLIGLAGPYDFLPFAGKIVAEAFGAVQDHDRDATQPVCHVAPGAPPAFLASGDQDNIVLPAIAMRWPRGCARPGWRWSASVMPGSATSGWWWRSPSRFAARPRCSTTWRHSRTALPAATPPRCPPTPSCPRRCKPIARACASHARPGVELVAPPPVAERQKGKSDGAATGSGRLTRRRAGTPACADAVAASRWGLARDNETRLAADER